MRVYVITGALLAGLATGAVTGWKVQAWRMGLQQARHTTEQARADLRQFEASQARSTRLQESADHAAQQAAQRAQHHQRAADRTRTELDRLRHTIATTAPVCRPQAASPATPDTTDPARELFAQCAAQLADLARAADGHARDALMLWEGWPGTPPD